MNRFRNKVIVQLIFIYTRYIIGGAFVFASLIKIKGKRFTTESGEFEPIDSAWHLFETLYQSGIYWKFIGIGQLVAGCLLMTQKYSKLGALLSLPILANIFVITISYDFAYTPVITALMLLAGIALLIREWGELKILFNLTPVISSEKRFEDDKVWVITGITLFLFTLFYRIFINTYNIFFWAGVCFVIGLTGFVFGMKRVLEYKNK